MEAGIDVSQEGGDNDEEEETAAAPAPAKGESRFCRRSGFCYRNSFSTEG
jgi:hypothetical protein